MKRRLRIQSGIIWVASFHASTTLCKPHHYRFRLFLPPLRRSLFPSIFVGLFWYWQDYSKSHGWVIITFMERTWDWNKKQSIRFWRLYVCICVYICLCALLCHIKCGFSSKYLQNLDATVYSKRHRLLQHTHTGQWNMTSACVVLKLIIAGKRDADEKQWAAEPSSCQRWRHSALQVTCCQCLPFRITLRHRLSYRRRHHQRIQHFRAPGNFSDSSTALLYDLWRYYNVV